MSIVALNRVRLLLETRRQLINRIIEIEKELKELSKEYSLHVDFDKDEAKHVEYMMY